MAEAADGAAPEVAVPVPGLPGPARRISPEQRPRIIVVVLGYYLVPFVLVYLGLVAKIIPGGAPSGGLASAWPWLAGAAALVLLLYTFAQGEIRSGPGWIAVRRAVRWQVVTAATAASVRVKMDQSYGFVLRFEAQAGHQHVDFTPPGLRKRPGQAAAAFALAEAANGRGAAVDPAVGIVFEGFGFPSLVSTTASPEEDQSRMGNLHGAHGRPGWVSRLVVTIGVGLFCVQVGGIALVVLVRLLGYR